MRVLRSKKLMILAGAVVAAAALAAVGLASAWTTTVQTDSNNVRLRVVSTIASDYDSGWHMHPGPAIVQVTLGSFQFYQGSCTPKTVSAGETFVEVPGVPVSAVAVGRIDWTTSLIVPYGSAVSTPVTPSPCP